MTSLVLNNYLGGEIVWVQAVLPEGKEISYYFNKIDGKELDFTRSQFPKSTKISTGIAKIKDYSSTREVLHTLNSTRVATSRVLVAILENNQNEDGSIDIPKVLWPITGFKKIESNE